MNISTTIKRQYFDAIWEKKKPIEYRADTPYWRKRIEGRTIDKITFLCGRESLTCRVAFWSRIPTPADLRDIIKTPECFAIHLMLDTVVATVMK